MAKSNIRFKWNDELEEAFKECKRLMLDTKSGILRTPVEMEPYILFTDASKSHIDSILAQVQQASDKEVSEEKIQRGTKRIYLIKFYSKMLEERDLSLPICLKELFSLSESLKHFHTRLIGNEIHVFVDSRVVSYWCSMDLCSERVARAMAIIQQHMITIRFVPSTLMRQIS
jgi:hypothetical protein